MPRDVGRVHAGSASTQQAFGRFFVDLARADEEVAKRVVTVSPDVASSTSLGGWINRAGVWNMGERIDWFADDADTLVRWRESVARPAHRARHRRGQPRRPARRARRHLVARGLPLLPIGALYDPFVNRALEPWSFGIYAGGQSILVGTPSGVTLAPEGGAHQSIITPSVGLEQPRCVAWEPAFGQDLEWTLLAALGEPRPAATAPPRTSASARGPSTRRSPPCPTTRTRARSAGARCSPAATSCARRSGAPDVVLVGMGAVLPDVLAAADELAAAGLAVDVVCLTSADLVFRALQARQGLLAGDDGILDALFPPSRRAPIVSVLDGHPHTLAFLSAVRCVPIASLGVHDFGQSGDVQDLYAHFGIDAETIIGAALDLTAGGDGLTQVPRVRRAGPGQRACRVLRAWRCGMRAP